MKRLHSSSLTKRNSKESLIAHSYNPINLQLSEDEIISLTTTFTSNGFHSIQADSLEQGRTLIHTFLHSLNYYHNPAVITLAQFNSNVIENVYYELLTGGLINETYFTEYLCNNFHHDFLWIESTLELLHAQWYKNFERALINLQFDKVMPIIVLSFKLT